MEGECYVCEMDSRTQDHQFPAPQKIVSDSRGQVRPRSSLLLHQSQVDCCGWHSCGDGKLNLHNERGDGGVFFVERIHGESQPVESE